MMQYDTQMIHKIFSRYTLKMQKLKNKSYVLRRDFDSKNSINKFYNVLNLALHWKVTRV